MFDAISDEWVRMCPPLDSFRDHGFIPNKVIGIIRTFYMRLCALQMFSLLAFSLPLRAGAQVSVGAVPATVGVLLVAHGGDSSWNQRVLDVAADVRTLTPIEVGFLMGPAARTRRFQDQVARLVSRGVQRIVVVPLLVSSFSGHFLQIRYLAGAPVLLDSAMMHHLHMAGLEPARVRVPLVVTPAMDDAPEVAALLAERARSLADDPASRALFIVAHGPNSSEDHAAWMRNLRIIADSVRARVPFRDVRVEVVRDDAPAAVRAEAVAGVRDLIELQYAATGKPVLVVPLFISQGSITRQNIPRDLAGLPIVYRGEPLLPSDHVTRWIERRVREAIRP